ncbi:MAG: NUDIX hydrolase, partial [Actinobacteria bacterium]|nr:NUDIX hydrolase [Actinomycetota bacterium]
LVVIELQMGAELREQVTNVLKGYIKTEMRTPDWHTMEWLNKRASQVRFQEIPRDLGEPDEARSLREKIWKQKLDERKSILEEANPSIEYKIDLDDLGEKATGQQALFEFTSAGKIRRMWAGTTVTLAQRGIYEEEGQTIVPIYSMNYTEWVACDNPAYTRAFRDAGLPLPYAGIGISVLMVTNDGADKDDRTYGLIPLTRRGIETPVYPGRLYSPGGGPKPGQNSLEAILEEIKEETGLYPGEHFNPDDLFMLAMVADTRYAGSEHSRPELVAYLPVNITFSEVEKIQYETSVKKGQKQEDVWGVVPFSAFTPNLSRAIIYNGPEMCPPTEAGLAHLMLYQEMRREGIEKALKNIETTMQRLKSFSRRSFAPPIERLAQMQ